MHPVQCFVTCHQKRADQWPVGSTGCVGAIWPFPCGWCLCKLSAPSPSSLTYSMIQAQVTGLRYLNDINAVSILLTAVNFLIDPLMYWYFFRTCGKRHWVWFARFFVFRNTCSPIIFSHCFMIARTVWRLSNQSKFVRLESWSWSGAICAKV